MSDSSPRLPARPSLEQLQKQAKDLLRQYRDGDPSARARINTDKGHVSLADAQFALAREYGFATWARLKEHVEGAAAPRIARYRDLATDIMLACRDDAAALGRLQTIFHANFSADQVRAQIAQRLNSLPGRTADESISLSDAQFVVARLYKFDTWDEFEASAALPASGRPPDAHGLSSSPPFYRIDRKNHSIEPRPPLFAQDWDEIFEVMRDHGINELHAAGQMTDAVLRRAARLDFLTRLDLSGSGAVTDDGLAHLAQMPQLAKLGLTGCSVTDRGLAVLSALPRLREFHMAHHHGVSDAGLAHLAGCHQLERVELLGSNAGDGVIRALAGKLKLRRFHSGDGVTDRGLSLLHEIPTFKTWQGGTPEYSLMGFDASPNYLLLRGDLTDQGMERLNGLDGLFALNLDDARLGITASGLRPLANLANLGWLGFDAIDESMAAIAALPKLRMLMCQDTKAGDEGFKALSRSPTIEYIWGRRCYNLTGAGFRAMAAMPSLLGLSVSCKNVDDTALAALPEFPALTQFMPMDVPDAGFRHVGRCERIEALWCMYCRDTGDAATEHIANLPHLKTYYAGQTRITDRSLELLSHMQTLEHLTFSACAGVTNAGVAMLSALPRLRELNLESMPGVSRLALTAFSAGVRVNIGT